MPFDAQTAWSTTGNIAAIVSILASIASVVAALRSKGYRNGAERALNNTRSRLELSDLSKLEAEHTLVMKGVHRFNQDPSSPMWAGKKFSADAMKITKFADLLSGSCEAFGPSSASVQRIAKELMKHAAGLTGPKPAAGGKEIFALMTQLHPLIKGSLRLSTLKDEERK